MVYTLPFSLQYAVCFKILTYFFPVLFTIFIQCVLKFKKNFRHRMVNLNASSKIITHPSHLSNVLGTTVHVQRGWSLCPVSDLSLPQLSVQEAAKYSPLSSLGRPCDSDTANSRSSKSILKRAIAISSQLPNACYIYILSIRHSRASDDKPLHSSLSLLLILLSYLGIHNVAMRFYCYNFIPVSWPGIWLHFV